MSETFVNQLHAHVVTPIGTHCEISIRHYCLDVGNDIDALRGLPDGELTRLCKGAAGPIVTVRGNAAPILWAIYDVPQMDLAPFED